MPPSKKKKKPVSKNISRKETIYLGPKALKIEKLGLETLVNFLEEHQIADFEWETSQTRLKISKHTQNLSAPTVPNQSTSFISQHPTHHTAEHAQPSQSPPKGEMITSPFVGTFFRSPSPTASPFVEIGSHIKKGKTLCIIEAMKLMNEIEAESDGTILEILVENGQPVEYGEPLFIIG